MSDSYNEPARRIVQVLPAFWRNPEFGGPVITAERLSEHLNSLGCEVCLVSSWFAQKGFKRQWCSSGVEVCNGRRILYLGHIFAFRWSCIDLFGLKEAFKWVDRADVVVVHGFRTFAGTCLTLYAAARRKTCWLYSHGMVGRKFRSFAAKWVFDSLIGSHLLKRYSAVFYFSANERRELLTAHVPAGRLVQLLPQPCAFRTASAAPFRSRLGLDGNHKIIAFLGRICRIKNLKALLDAFALCGRPEWHLLYVGPCEEEAYARELGSHAAGLGVTDRFHLLSPVYGAAKHDLLTDSDVVVLPSLYESFGWAAWEAYSLGTQVVVSERCGVAQVLPECSRVISGTDAETLARALVEAMDRPKPQVPPPSVASPEAGETLRRLLCEIPCSSLGAGRKRSPEIASGAPLESNGRG